MIYRKVQMLILLGLLVPLFLLSGCAVTPAPQRQQPPTELSAADKLEISKQAYRQIVQQYGGIYPDRELNQYLAEVGQRLVRQLKSSQLDYRFQLLNESRPLAFSLPDGSVAISRSLLVRLQSEAQLAAVLGSEIGHIVSGHHLQGLDADALRGDSVALLAELSADSKYADLVSRLSRAGADLISKRFSDAQEAEADRVAVDLMMTAGYSPKAAVEVQQLYLDQMVAEGDQNLDSLFYSHPFADERLVAVNAYIADQTGVNAGEEGAVDFLLRVEPLRALTKGYALYDQGRLLEKQQRTDDAINVYHQALLEAPEEPLIMTGLGLAYLRNEDLVPARRYLIKAVNLQGDYAQSRLGLGYVYLQKWQYAQAIGQLEKSLELLPTIEAAFLLAQAQQQVGQKSSARDLYLIVSSVDGDGRLGSLAAERLQSLQGE